MEDHPLEQGNPEDSLWLAGGLVFMLGTIVPNLTVAAYNEQVLAMTGGARFALLLAVDSIFIAVVYYFLLVGEAFARQRHGSTAAYPGPWAVSQFQKEGPYSKGSMRRKPPQHLSPYVKILPVATGVLMPIALTVAAAFGGSQLALLAASVVVPYLVAIYAQIKHEVLFIKRASAMWPMVPVAHMLYRYLQLARGAWLVGALHGPVWLQWLAAYLACLWTFNFGCVMSWMSSMLYWHRQATQD